MHKIDREAIFCLGSSINHKINLKIRNTNHSWYVELPQTNVIWICQCFLHTCQKCPACSAKPRRINFQSLQHYRWLTDWADLVLPPLSVSPATEHLLSAGITVLKPPDQPLRHDWQWRKNKQPWIMIIGWSAPAQVQHRRHAQLINCSAEAFYNKHNNNLLTDGSHFP